MKLWLLLALALLVQEGTSTTVLLVEARADHYSLLLIHILWFVLTIAQIIAGYYIGRWVQQRAKHTKMERWIEKQSKSLNERIGRRGEKLALAFASFFISPGLTAIAASWLDIPLKTVIIYAFIGDIVWYVSEWATAVGAAQLLTSVHSIL